MKWLVRRLPLLTAALLLHGAAQAHARPARVVPAGGTSLLLEVKAEAPTLKRKVERTAEVIRKRCKLLGIKCDVRPRAGEAANRLALDFSAPPDAGRVRKILLAAGMEVRAVSSLPNPFPLLEYATRDEAEAAARAGEEVFPLRRYGGEESFIITKREPIVTADRVRGATVLKSGEGVGWYEVDCRLDANGSNRLERWSSLNIDRYLVVIYDGQAIDANYVKSPIWLNVVVAGGLNRQRAEDAALVIRSGNLPAPVVVLEEASPKR